MYIGNDLQIAHPSYKIIDDISSSFNGSTTSFALQVNGQAPVPFPISTQQVMISVNGVVQEPDPSGSAGFKLLGSNIVFSSAPANGHAFFGVINAGSDYVTAGSEFPDGSATAPSFTFQDDQDTGWFRSGSGAVGYSANGAQTLTFDGNGLTVTGDASFVGDSSKNLLWDKSDGALEFADDAKVVFGTSADGLEIFHNGSNSVIKDTGTGNLSLQTNDSNVNIWNSTDSEYIAQFVGSGACSLYHAGTKRFETTSTGFKTLGDLSFRGSADSEKILFDPSSSHLKFSDDVKAKFGTGGDLEIFHDGSSSYIKDAGSGNLELISNIIDFRNAADDAYLARYIQSDRVELYYNGVKRIETTSTGATVTGTLVADGLTVDTNTLHVDATNNRVGIGTTNPDNELEVQGATDPKIKIESQESGNKRLELWVDGGAAVGYIAANQSASSLQFQTTNTTALTISSTQNATFAGTVSDSKGNLRSVPHNSQTSNYTLVASDAGKVVSTNTTGWVIPASTFSGGDAVTLMNRSSGDLTIDASALTTLYNSADGANVKASTLTLATRTMATIWFEASSSAYIQASALTVS